MKLNARTRQDISNGTEAYSHLPPDIADVIARYDADVLAGKIRFDAEGFATDYPGQEASERALAEHTETHTRL